MPTSSGRETVRSSRPSSARSRILPQSKADVEAALAAVRRRTEKLRLQSPENADFETLRPTSAERRQLSSRESVTSSNGVPLDHSTLQSVTDYIGKLNSNHTRGGAIEEAAKTQKNIPTYDDDSSDDSSDDDYGVSGVNLQDISAMIDKVQQKNIIQKNVSTNIHPKTPKPQNPM